MPIGKATPTGMLTGPALEARRKYQREWNAANADKRREYMARYWARKAAEQAGNGDSERNKAEQTGTKKKVNT